MMDPGTVSTLYAILRREGRSLLQYSRDAYPWTSADERDVVASLQRMIDDERSVCDAISRLLIRRRLTLPFIGAYPMAFTSYNFITLGKLTSLLAEHQRQSLAALRPQLAAVNDPDARLLVQQLLDMKQSHLRELERMAAATPAAVTT